jgi:hypothetical protein
LGRSWTQTASIFGPGMKNPRKTGHYGTFKGLVLRTFRPLRLRSVPLCRSTKAVLIAVLAIEAAKATVTAATVPKITRESISVIRPFSRVLCVLVQPDLEESPR